MLGLGALANPGLRTLVFASLPVGFALGSIEVAVPAFSEAEGSKALAGVLLAVWSLRKRRGRAGLGRARLALPAARRPTCASRWLLPLAIAPLALAFSPLTMGMLVVLAGLPIAPLIASRNQLVERVTPRGHRHRGVHLAADRAGRRRLPRRGRGGRRRRGELVDGRGARRGRGGDVAASAPAATRRAGDPSSARRAFDIDLMLNVRAGHGRHTSRVESRRMGVIKGDKSVEIEAPIERCYEIAADIENAVDWQGSLKDVEVLERDGERRPRLVETESDAKVKNVRAVLRFSYDPPTGDPLGAGEGRHQVADRVVDASRTWAAAARARPTRSRPTRAACSACCCAARPRARCATSCSAARPKASSRRPRR